jgi:hypothetical protein
VLLEFDPVSTSQALFSMRDMPRTLRPSDFSPDRLQRRVEGQGGAQFFFQEAGRAFCLYVVLGSFVDRVDLIPRVDEVLGRVRFS